MLSSNLWYQNPRPSASGGLQEPWLNKLIYTRMPSEMPASHFGMPGNRNREAGLQRFGISEQWQQMERDRLGSSDKEKDEKDFA